MDGIVSINKATGMTSHDVVAKVRKLLKQKRVGHAGTLDPAASGVLPICVGLGTRVAEYLSESGKEYEATITFGIVTDTYDAEGEIVRTHDASHLTAQHVSALFPRFLGPQLQYPPRYSAIKLQGQPAYKRVRAGEDVTLAARPIEISQLQLLDWQAGTTPRATVAVTCSKGTYIRSLAYDIGEQLGCGAHLSALIRTRSGPFTLAESVTLDDIAHALAQGTLARLLVSPDRVLANYPALFLDETTTAAVLHGNPFQYASTIPLPVPAATLARVYDTEGHFLAIATWDAQREHWQPKKVFAQEPIIASNKRLW